MLDVSSGAADRGAERVVHRRFRFLASLDELLISMFFAGVHAQKLPVRILEPTIAPVNAFLIGVTTHAQHRSRPAAPDRDNGAGAPKGQIAALRNQEMGRRVADPRAAVSLMIAVSPSDMLRLVKGP